MVGKFKFLKNILFPWKKLSRKRRRKILLISIGVIVVLLPIVVYTFLNVIKAEAAWFNDSWTYRKSIAITSHTSTESNVYISVTIDTSDITRFQPDCGDIRFTDYGGNILPYYIVSGCSTSTTVIHVFFKNFPAGAQTIYYYYGNPTAADGFSLSDFATQATSYVVGSIGSEETTNGPILYWKFDEGQGTAVNNSAIGSQVTNTGTGVDGTLDLSLGGGVGGCNGVGLGWNAATNTCTATGSGKTIFNFTTINIPAGKTLNTSSTTYPTLYATGNVTIAGAVNLNGLGFAYDLGPGAGADGLSDVGNGFYDGGSGAGFGGTGGVGGNGGMGGTNTVGATYDTFSMGSGGGLGGSTLNNTGTGGGGISIISKGNINVSGSVTANGANGKVASACAYAGGGGGSGGKIFLAALGTFTNTGSITANGGNGGNGSIQSGVCDEGAGGGGGGGRITLLGSSVTQGTTTVSGGGTGVTHPGGSGNSGVVTTGNTSSIPKVLLSGNTTASWATSGMCVSSNCLSFNGTTASVSASITVNNVNTVSFWVRPQTTSQYFVDLDGGTHYIYASGGTVTAAGFATPTVYVNGVVNGPLLANQWQLITVTTSTAFNASAITIGKVGSNWLTGYVDEFKIYNYVRSSTQVDADFNSRGAYKGATARFGPDNSVLSNGLIGYWNMDEKSGAGSTLADSSGNGNNGTAVLWGGGNTSTDSAHVVGKFGNSFSFDGVDDYIDAGNNTNYNLSSTSHTISAWFNISSLPSNGDGMIVQRFTGGSPGAGYYLSIQPAGYVFYNERSDNTSNQLSMFSNHSYVDSKWHHVVVTVDINNKVGKIYVDGIDDTVLSTSTYLGTLLDYNANLTIGGRQATNNFKGKLDEVRIYNRLLSASDIKQLYNYAPGPVAYYDFEQSPQSGILYDKSGNGINGTITGTSWDQGKYGKAYSFNGSSGDTVNLGNPNALNFGTGSFTYSLWVNQSSFTGPYDMAIYKGGASAGNPGFDLELGSGAWVTNITDGTTAYTGYFSDNPISQWVYLTVVVDRNLNQLITYVNGIPYDHISISGFGSVSNGSENVQLSRSDNYFFLGKMDDVRFYNYARSPSQVIEDMNSGVPAVTTPTLYYKFDEGYGQFVNNSGSGGTDLYKATLGTSSSTGSDDPAWVDGKYSRALKFNGGQYVRLLDNDHLEMHASQDFSFSFWMRRGSSGGTTAYLLAKGAGGGASDPGYAFALVNNTTPTCYLGQTTTGTLSTTGTNITDFAWHHIVCSYTRNGTLNYYIDGVNNASTDISADFSMDESNANDFYVGSNSTPASPFIGLIDEVKVYGYAISSDQVISDMNRGINLSFGSLSDTSSLTGGALASNSASAVYCVPGSTDTCTPPTAYYNFEEGTGGNTVNDISGNGNNATWSGTGNHSTNSKFGKAGSFDGIDDFATVTFNSALDIGNGPGTYELWFKQSAIGADRYLMERGAGVPYLALNSANNIYFGAENSAAAAHSSITVTDTNQWHFLVGTIDSSHNWKIYLDGVNVTVVDGTPTPNGGVTSNLVLGKQVTTTPADFFPGAIDEVKIFKYARTPSQIAWDYNQGKPIAYWKFDECQGSVAHDSVGTNSANITIGAGGTQAAIGTCGSSGTAWGNGVTGKYNASLNFDGGDDSATVVNPSMLPIGSAPRSVFAWVKPGASNLSGSVVTYGLNSNGKESGLDVFSGKAYFVGFNADLSGNTTLNSGTWYNIGYVYDGTNISIYVNGVLDKGPTPIALSTSSSNIGIGWDLPQSTLYFNGQIDDARIYNYALTQAQIKQVYNQGSVVRFGPLTGSP